ncbi:MAG: hypothetical protein ACI32N_09140 [Bulleidia sp.]
MKKMSVIMASVAGVCAIGLSTVFVHGNDQPVPVSKEEILETSKVTDEEIARLAELGINYDEIVDEAEKETETIDRTYGNGQKVLFLSDGSWVSGDMTGYDKSGLKISAYNSDTDPNAVSWDEGMELTTLQNIRSRVDYALGLK